MSEAETNFEMLAQRTNNHNENNGLNELIDNSNQAIDSTAPTNTNEEGDKKILLGKKRNLKPKHKKKAKRKKNYRIQNTTNLSIERSNNSTSSQNQNLSQNNDNNNEDEQLPWDQIQEDDNDNALRQVLILLLRNKKIEIDLINLDIKLLELKREELKYKARDIFTLLQHIPVEVSTEASSEQENE